MVRFVSLFSQERNVIPDSNMVSQDTLVSDTLTSRLIKKISPEAIDGQVTYKSRGRKKNDLVNKRAILIDQAEVTYKDIEIKADSIVFDMLANTVFAAGRTDSTGKVAGTPVFKQGTQEIEAGSFYITL
jgi:hypothetical protein